MENSPFVPSTLVFAQALEFVSIVLDSSECEQRVKVPSGRDRERVVSRGGGGGGVAVGVGGSSRIRDSRCCGR